MTGSRVLIALLSLAVWLLPSPLNAQEPLPANGSELSSDGDVEAELDDSEPDPPPGVPITAPTLDDNQYVSEAKDVELELAQVLRRHRFCHADDYRLDFEERRLCQLVSEAKERCPGLEKACQLPHLEEPDWNFSFGNLDLSGVGEIARLLFWTLVVVGLAALVVSIARRVIATHADEDEVEVEKELVEDEVAPPQLASETDVDRLLNRARAAAERGDYAAAIRDAYAALLRKLDADGLIEIHRSRTNGDYRRKLRDQPIHGEFSIISRSVEAVQFGSETPNRERWLAFWSRLSGILGRASMLLFLVVSAVGSVGCGDRLVRASNLGCGENPGGYSVLCEMLRVDGAEVRRRIEKVEAIDEGVAQVVALPGTDLHETEWETLEEWVKEGHTLVLASGLTPLHQELGVFIDSNRCREASELTEGNELFYGGKNTRLATTHEWPFDTRKGVAWTIVACDEGPTVMGMQHGEGTVLFLANKALLTNVSMASADNAKFVVNLLSQSGHSVEVLGDWTGSGSHNPLEALGAANLTPWVLQLFVLGLLVALWRGPHFGRPRDVTTQKRHAFVEHIQALGLRYARSKASRHALANYAGWALGRLADRLLPGEKRGLGELSQAIARKTGRPEAEVLEVLIAAKSAADAEHDTATVKEHLETMRQLEALLQSSGGSGERRSIL